MPVFLSHNPTFSSNCNDFNLKIADLVYSFCLREVPALLQHTKDNYERFLLLLCALNIALNAGLLVFVAKYTAYAIKHADTMVYMHCKKKYMCPYGHTWVMRERRVGYPLAVFCSMFAGG